MIERLDKKVNGIGKNEDFHTVDLIASVTHNIGLLLERV
jgi:hypothetical protein